MLKPEDMGGLVGGSNNPDPGSGGSENYPGIGPASSTEVPQIDSDVYDPVTERKNKKN